MKLQIGKLYFDMLKNIYLLRIDQENINRYQSISTIIQALTGRGIKAGVDPSLAKAELSKIKGSYNQRIGGVDCGEFGECSGSFREVITKLKG